MLPENQKRIQTFMKKGEKRKAKKNKVNRAPRNIPFEIFNQNTLLKGLLRDELAEGM